MAFWRRRRDQAPEPPALPAPAPSRESFEAEASPAEEARQAADPPPEPRPSDPAPLEPQSPEPATLAPFDPTAFLAVAPTGSLDTGLERTRSTFITQLRGYLGDAHGVICPGNADRDVGGWSLSHHWCAHTSQCPRAFGCYTATSQMR